MSGSNVVWEFKILKIILVTSSGAKLGSYKHVNTIFANEFVLKWFIFVGFGLLIGGHFIKAQILRGNGQILSTNAESARLLMDGS